MISTLDGTCRSEGRWNPRYVWPTVMWIVLVVVLIGAGAFVADVPREELAFRELGIAEALSRST